MANPNALIERSKKIEFVPIDYINFVETFGHSKIHANYKIDLVKEYGPYFNPKNSVDGIKEPRTEFVLKDEMPTSIFSAASYKLAQEIYGVPLLDSGAFCFGTVNGWVLFKLNFQNFVNNNSQSFYSNTFRDEKNLMGKTGALYKLTEDLLFAGSPIYDFSNKAVVEGCYLGYLFALTTWISTYLPNDKYTDFFILLEKLMYDIHSRVIDRR